MNRSTVFHGLLVAAGVALAGIGLAIGLWIVRGY